MPSTAVVWFRRDLRLHDHPALHHAVESFDRVVPLYVVDDALLDGRWASAEPDVVPGPGARRRSAARSRSAAAALAVRPAAIRGRPSSRSRGSIGAEAILVEPRLRTVRPGARRGGRRGGRGGGHPVPGRSRPARPRAGGRPPRRRRAVRGLLAVPSALAGAAGPRPSSTLRTAIPASADAAGRGAPRPDPTSCSATRADRRSGPAPRARRAGRPRAASTRGRAPTRCATTTPAGTGSRSTARRGSARTSAGGRCRRSRCSTRCAGTGRGPDPLPLGDRLARLLRPPALARAARRAREAFRREFDAIAWETDDDGARGLARRADRLPDRRRRDAPAARHRLDAQPRPDDRGVVPDEAPAASTGESARRTSWSTSSTATRRATTAAGSGRRRPGRTRSRTSGSSTRRSRAGATTRTATTSGAGCPELRGRRRRPTSTSRRRARTSRRSSITRRPRSRARRVRECRPGAIPVSRPDKARSVDSRAVASS